MIPGSEMFVKKPSDGARYAWVENVGHSRNDSALMSAPGDSGSYILLAPGDPWRAVVTRM